MLERRPGRDWLRRRGKWLLLGAVGFLPLLGGCAATSSHMEMFWPDPPEKTRIRFVKSLRSKDDVGGPSVMEVLAGRQPVAALSQPMGVAVSEDGQRLYVADFGWNAVFVFDLGAKALRAIGTEERYPLAQPIGVALDAQENVYVTDTGTRTVRVHDRSGKFLKAIGKDILVRGTGIAVDRARGRLYVVDTGFNDQRAHDVKVFDLEGQLVSQIGRRGGGDGEFNFPTYAQVDREGRLYVVDSANFRVQVFGPDGTFLRKFGATGDRLGSFARPKAVDVDGFGNIYVVDSRWSNVQIFSGKGDLLMAFGGTGSHPGLMLNPAAIAIDRANRIYVSDTLNQRVNVYDLVNTTPEDSLESPEGKGGG